TMGQSPPGDTYNEIGEGLPFYQGRTDFGFRFPTRRVFCTAPTRFAEANDTLVSVRAPVGDINLAAERCCIGRGVAAIRHESRAISYTYHTVHSLADAFAHFEAEGTVFGSIGKKEFQGIKCLAPPAGIIDAFEALASPLDQAIAIDEQQSQTLAGLRDALLPRLLSGKLRVAEAAPALARSSA
ncbi:MAG: restriction endonuclease subunit S, partial [Armatimonadetes bacterium]|nr:restriction endonuclease subunit S [Armatimonadota bacterium]